DRRSGAHHTRHDQPDRHGGGRTVAGGRGDELLADAYRPGGGSGRHGNPGHRAFRYEHHAEHEWPEASDRAFPPGGVTARWFGLFRPNDERQGGGKYPPRRTRGSGISPGGW